MPDNIHKAASQDGASASTSAAAPTSVPSITSPGGHPIPRPAATANQHGLLAPAALPAKRKFAQGMFLIILLFI